MKLTAEQKIERMWDAQEVQKVMSKYAYLHNAHMHEETAALFADRDDVWLECGGMGIYKGKEGIRNFMVVWHESLTGDEHGAFNEHLLTTPIVEVAADGKTAKAVWMSPGVETRRMLPKGELEASWIWGKYGVDFIKEGDEWKFWHFTITLDFLCDYYHSWVDVEDGHAKRVMNNGVPANDAPNSFEEDGYTKKKITALIPPIPEPYETFEG